MQRLVFDILYRYFRFQNLCLFHTREPNTYESLDFCSKCNMKLKNPANAHKTNIAGKEKQRT